MKAGHPERFRGLPEVTRMSDSSSRLAPVPAGELALARAQGETWLAMAAFALVAAFGVAARPLLPIDETRYLAVAWEMRLRGDWIVPHLNGLPYAQKPPLLFWLMNLVWDAAGVTETAARLVGPAFGVAMIWATSRLARRLWPEDPGIGGRAAMVLAGLAGFAVFAGLTMFDTLLGTAVLGGVLSLAGAGHRARGWAGLGLALAAGALAKGPVILIHLLPVAVATPLWLGIRPRAMLRGLGLALGLGLAVVALWLVPAVLLGGPEYRAAVLWTQSAGRVTDSFAHARPWWFFLALLPVLLWPYAWSLPLWRRLARLAPRRDAGLRLTLAWGGSALVLFSLVSGKQAHYLVPTLPAAALVAARAMQDAPVSARAAALLPALLGAACLAAGFGAAPAGLAPLATPRPVFGALGIGWLGLACLAWRLRGTGLTWVGLGLPLLANLAVLPGAAGAIYDPTPIATLVAPSDAAGIAVLGDSYNGEFTFAGRLRHDVATLSPETAAHWLAAVPGRVLVARLDRPRPPGDPAVMLLYRNHPYGLWQSPAPRQRPPAAPETGRPGSGR